MNVFDWQNHRKRAEQLLRESFAFDFVPLGEPCIPTRRHLNVMKTCLEQGLGIEETQRSMLDDRIAELIDSAECRAEVARSWQSSGVKAAIVTLGGRELEPTNWTAIVRDIAYWKHRESIGGIALMRTFDRNSMSLDSEKRHVILGLQDASAVDEGGDRLEHLFMNGVRVIQLTYNERNAFGDGCKSAIDEGLSSKGKHLIRRMNRMGIVVDTAHCGPKTTLDAVAASSSPIAVTHSFCRFLFEHPRGKTDDLLRSLRDTGGYFGITVIPSFFVKTGRASLLDFVRHVEHAASILPIEQIGIGSDFGWITPDTPRELVAAGLRKFVQLGFEPEDLAHHGEGVIGFESWGDWPNIPAALLAAGMSETDVKEVIGGSWARLFTRVWPGVRSN